MPSRFYITVFQHMKANCTDSPCSQHWQIDHSLGTALRGVMVSFSLVKRVIVSEVGQTGQK